VQDWVDERLVWDENISDLKEVVVHSGNIWRPEFAVINGYEKHPRRCASVLHT